MAPKRRDPSSVYTAAAVRRSPRLSALRRSPRLASITPPLPTPVPKKKKKVKTMNRPFKPIKELDTEKNRTMVNMRASRSNKRLKTKLVVAEDEENNGHGILPSDIMKEVLCRLPPKSLIKLQLVCKQWQSIIRGPHFMEKFENRSKISHYYYTTDASKSPLSRGNRSAYENFYSRYGLLFIKTTDDKKYCLWNPAIRRLLVLPDPHKGSYGYALSYVSATRSYKILSVYKDGHSGDDACEVLTPGCSNAWRRLTSFPHDMARVVSGLKIRSKQQKKVSVVSTGDDVHCVRILKKVGTETRGEVVSVDMRTESLSVNSIPTDWVTFRALEWEGKLGFADIVGENLHVMVLEDYKKQRWSQNKKIIPLLFMKKNNYGEGSLIPLFAKQGALWFAVNKLILICSTDTGLVTNTLTLQSHIFQDKFYPYNRSMVSFEGMVPDTKLQAFRPGSTG